MYYITAKWRESKKLIAVVAETEKDEYWRSVEVVTVLKGAWGGASSLGSGGNVQAPLFFSSSLAFAAYHAEIHLRPKLAKKILFIALKPLSTTIKLELEKI